MQQILSIAFGSQLRRNMTSGLIRAGGNVITLFVSYPIYLKFLGYERYGVWLVMSTVLAFAQMGNLGITQAITKLVSEEHGRGDKRAIEDYVSMALSILCISGTVVLIIVLLFKSQIISLFGLESNNRQTALWLLPYMGIFCIYIFFVQTLNSAAMGLGRMDIANYLQLGGNVSAIVLTVGLLFGGGGIESMLIGNFLSYVIIHLGTYICLKRISSARLIPFTRWDRVRFKKLIHFGGGVFSTSVLALFVDPFNKLMLSRYAGVASLPVFDIAFRGSVQIRSLLESGLGAILPEVSKLSGINTAEAWERVRKIYRKSYRGLFGASVIYFVLFVFAVPLLKIWLKNQFRPEIPAALRIMLIVSFISLLSVSAFYLIMGLGKIKVYIIGAILGVFLNVASVSTVVLVKNKLSVLMLGFCLLISFSFSTI